MLELKAAWPGKPMTSRNELIKKRRQELLEKGFRPGIVDLAMDWAWGSAEGMATYVRKHAISDNPGEQLEDLAVQFLPQYLNDAETYIRSFGHEPEKA